jgi:hypothetical protein
MERQPLPALHERARQSIEDAIRTQALLRGDPHSAARVLHLRRRMNEAAADDARPLRTHEDAVGALGPSTADTHGQAQWLATTADAEHSRVAALERHRVVDGVGAATAGIVPPPPGGCRVTATTEFGRRAQRIRLHARLATRDLYAPVAPGPSDRDAPTGSSVVAPRAPQASNSPMVNSFDSGAPRASAAESNKRHQQQAGLPTGGSPQVVLRREPYDVAPGLFEHAHATARDWWAPARAALGGSGAKQAVAPAAFLPRRRSLDLARARAEELRDGGARPHAKNDDTTAGREALAAAHPDDKNVTRVPAPGGGHVYVQRAPVSTASHTTVSSAVTTPSAGEEAADAASAQNARVVPPLRPPLVGAAWVRATHAENARLEVMERLRDGALHPRGDHDDVVSLWHLLLTSREEARLLRQSDALMRDRSDRSRVLPLRSAILHPKSVSETMPPWHARIPPAFVCRILGFRAFAETARAEVLPKDTLPNPVLADALVAADGAARRSLQQSASTLPRGAAPMPITPRDAGAAVAPHPTNAGSNSDATSRPAGNAAGTSRRRRPLCNHLHFNYAVFPPPPPDAPTSMMTHFVGEVDRGEVPEVELGQRLVAWELMKLQMLHGVVRYDSCVEELSSDTGKLLRAPLRLGLAMDSVAAGTEPQLLEDAAHTRPHVVLRPPALSMAETTAGEAAWDEFAQTRDACPAADTLRRVDLPFPCAFSPYEWARCHVGAINAELTHHAEMGALVNAVVLAAWALHRRTAKAEVARRKAARVPVDAAGAFAGSPQDALMDGAQVDELPVLAWDDPVQAYVLAHRVWSELLFPHLTAAEGLFLAECELHAHDMRIEIPAYAAVSRRERERHVDDALRGLVRFLIASWAESASVAQLRELLVALRTTLETYEPAARNAASGPESTGAKVEGNTVGSTPPPLVSFPSAPRFLTLQHARAAGAQRKPSDGAGALVGDGRNAARRSLQIQQPSALPSHDRRLGKGRSGRSNNGKNGCSGSRIAPGEDADGDSAEEAGMDDTTEDSWRSRRERVQTRRRRRQQRLKLPALDQMDRRQREAAVMSGLVELLQEDAKHQAAGEPERDVSFLSDSLRALRTDIVGSLGHGPRAGSDTMVEAQTAAQQLRAARDRERLWMALQRHEQEEEQDDFEARAARLDCLLRRDARDTAMLTAQAALPWRDPTVLCAPLPPLWALSSDEAVLWWVRLGVIDGLHSRFGCRYRSHCSLPVEVTARWAALAHRAGVSIPEGHRPSVTAPSRRVSGASGVNSAHRHEGPFVAPEAPNVLHDATGPHLTPEMMAAATVYAEKWTSMNERVEAMRNSRPWRKQAPGRHGSTSPAQPEKERMARKRSADTFVTQQLRQEDQEHDDFAPHAAGVAAMPEAPRPPGANLSASPPPAPGSVSVSRGLDLPVPIPQLLRRADRAVRPSRAGAFLARDDQQPRLAQTLEDEEAVAMGVPPLGGSSMLVGPSLAGSLELDTAAHSATVSNPLASASSTICATASSFAPAAGARWTAAASCITRSTGALPAVGADAGRLRPPRTTAGRQGAASVPPAATRSVGGAASFALAGQTSPREVGEMMSFISAVRRAAQRYKL